MKLFFLDLETTGVKYWRNGIHQISGCIEIDGEVKESFNFKVQPFKGATIEDEALAIGGINRAGLEDYSLFEDVYAELLTILSRYVDKYNKKDKFFLVGYNNAAFDNSFFRAFFVQNGDNYFGSWFWANPIDVYVLASFKLMSERVNMVDGKLKTVAAYLGILVDESKLHDAAYDIELTMSIYKIVTDPYYDIEAREFILIQEDAYKYRQLNK
jgi:DNA polymerase-3 subunit epsilon